MLHLNGRHDMHFTAKTYLDATLTARRLRALYARDGWTVSIVRPLFDGDTYRINVA
jgi:hypothetical protein